MQHFHSAPAYSILNLRSLFFEQYSEVRNFSLQVFDRSDLGEVLQKNRQAVEMKPVGDVAYVASSTQGVARKTPGCYELRSPRYSNGRSATADSAGNSHCSGDAVVTTSAPP